MTTDTTKLMTCMEVWGGNQKTDTGVVMPGLDAWIYAQPWQHEDAGGDVHYVSSCASGQITRMLVADVSGHGLSVAKTASDLRSLMRRYVNDHDQARFVRSLNREFTAASQDGIFATAVAMTFDSPTNNLLICNAGHPPPLWYQGASRKWTYLVPDQAEGANVPWGIVDSVNYEQFAVRLKVNDLVLCYTDSLIEARDGCGQLIGQAGLLDLVNKLDHPNPATLLPRLLKSIKDQSSECESGDDVTCLLIRPNGLRPRVPYFDKLFAVPRVIGVWCGVQFGWIGRPTTL